MQNLFLYLQKDMGISKRAFQKKYFSSASDLEIYVATYSKFKQEQITLRPQSEGRLFDIYRILCLRIILTNDFAKSRTRTSFGIQIISRSLLLFCFRMPSICWKIAQRLEYKTGRDRRNKIYIYLHLLPQLKSRCADWIVEELGLAAVVRLMEWKQDLAPAHQVRGSFEVTWMGSEN